MARVPVLGSLLVVLALLCGCGQISQIGTTSTLPAVKATGAVFGGQQPVTDATIQLWTVGTTGFGSAGTALLGTVTTSDGTGVVNSNANTGNANNTLAAGSFTITGAFTCPTANTLVYLTSTGGNPGLGGTVNNSAILLMAPLGQCGSLNSGTYVVLNEVTTAASAFVLTNFMSVSGNVGSPSDATSQQAIANAFASISSLVTISTGNAVSGYPKLSTLANALVQCVNTSSATSSACSTLFSDTTPGGGTVPTTVLGAVLNVALTPTLNTTPIYNLSTPNAPFQPALTGAPGAWNIGVTANAHFACGPAGGGDTISGTFTYSGSKTGRVYLAMNYTNGCLVGSMGTSVNVTAPGTYSYSIRGVPFSSSPYTYSVTAFMDTQGYGSTNAANPTGSSANFSVGAPNVTAPSFTLTDPSTVTVTSAPSLNQVGGVNNGAVVVFGKIKSNGVEIPTSYTLEWSTNASMTPIAGSKTFAAAGGDLNVWFLNGLTNGSVYYFAAYGSSAGTSVGPLSSVYGPVTIGAPSSGSNVSGQISYTGTATGPMYAGLYNQDSSSVAPYIQYLSSPVSAQPYSINVPNSSSAVYIPVAIIDQNNDGIYDYGDIGNIAIQGTPLAVTGTTTNQNLTLPSGNSLARVITLTQQNSGGTISYGLYFILQFGLKLPVSVTLLNSYNADGATIDNGPVDIASCAVNNTNCNNGQNAFQIFFNLNSTAPAVGDTYVFSVTYSDGTSETIPVAVTNVITTFPTSLFPQTGGSTSTTPTFTWTDPTCGACSTYTYTFNISTSTQDIWFVPGTGNGLAPGTTSVTWPNDPTQSSNTPSIGSLSPSTIYSWSVTVQDGNFNQAIETVNYQP